LYFSGWQSRAGKQERVRTQLVTIPTGTIPLEGAFHVPDSGKAAGAVLYFRG
jgi:hypothetical protein